jgi:site-specific recombinase XerD
MELRKTMLERGLKPVTINKHFNYFSSMMKWAVRQGYCSKLSYTLPKFQKKKLLPDVPTAPLTRRQVSALYEQIKPEYRLLFLLMADHGLRLEEALTLPVSGIDEERKLITVTGKGNKRRLVPFMSNRFEVELEPVLAKRIDGPLIVNEQTKAPYRTMWREVKRAAALAGITRKVNHHILRHTFATLAAESGMNPHALQRILGHADLSTTTKIYTNVSKDFVGKEVEIMRNKINV